jgi:hypothetical protein
MFFQENAFIAEKRVLNISSCIDIVLEYFTHIMSVADYGFCGGSEASSKFNACFSLHKIPVLHVG